jgi:hypothetical protein
VDDRVTTIRERGRRVEDLRELRRERSRDVGIDRLVRAN